MAESKDYNPQAHQVRSGLSAHSAKSIMIQGTSSGAGKSVLTAGLCRLLKQEGYKVAPFKSQNMALNSYVTTDGLEMGRAQVMQAAAAGIEPSVLMNPILLKPTNDVGSQVIVNGKVFKTMSAREYFEYKKHLIPTVMEAYQMLSNEYEIIVIEGAGSPAEINLKSEDIVNMGMAKMADAPVLLVADIDRGGVFASLYGTVFLLEPEERARIKGLIINKFRGDISILMPGVKEIEKLTGIPVVGTIPYLNIDLEDEDSLAPRFERKSEKGILDIAIIKLPKISNFTDFHALEQVEGVTVRYVTRHFELENSDAVIIPGTKNTMADLLWMRQNGIETAIKKRHAKGVIIFGICGGYQMMGRNISDPDKVEEGGMMDGIGIIPIKTIFKEEKTLSRVNGKINMLKGEFSELSNSEIEGYEIHMGQSFTEGDADSFCTLTSDKPYQDGAYYKNSAGCYLHGIFDSSEFTSAFLKILLTKKGLNDKELKPIDYNEYLENQYDILADSLRENLDINEILRIINQGAV